MCEEEFSALSWSLELRISSALGIGHRFVEGGDSLAALGAAAKGRSVARRMHRQCRWQMGLCLALKLVPVSVLRSERSKPSRST